MSLFNIGTVKLQQEIPLDSTDLCIYDTFNCSNNEIARGLVHDLNDTY